MTGVDVLTALVVAVKTSLVAPTGMVTLDGTESMPGLRLERETNAPPLRRTARRPRQHGRGTQHSFLGHEEI